MKIFYKNDPRNLTKIHLRPTKLYKNMNKIGEGAAGEVFVATHVKDGRKVAVKKMEINNENVKLLVTEIGKFSIWQMSTPRKTQK